jgi:hypothetical protein
MSKISMLSLEPIVPQWHVTSQSVSGTRLFILAGIYRRRLRQNN